MKKRVNVKITSPVFNVIPPITRTLLDVEMSTGDIRNCICSKARVEEILDNGKLLVLNLYNYNKDNNNKKKIKPKSEAKPPIKTAPPKKEAVNAKITPEVHPHPVEVKKAQPTPKPTPVEDKKETKVEQNSTPKQTVTETKKEQPVQNVKKEETKVEEKK